ncbi:MAG: hypothetical protein ACKO6B_01940, partial [Planctomycetia bacterium]
MEAIMAEASSLQGAISREGGRSPTMDGRLWFWAGLGFVAVAIALLELLDLYFFCQDDALALELPCVLLACRGIWQGLVPEYNPYIFLGSPTPMIGGT